MNKRQQKDLERTGRSQLKFHVLGAANAVTGSLFLYEFFERDKVTRFLVDVGLTVENPQADYQRRLPAGVKASDIDFVIISHAHVDHCGFLPKLIKDGFKGKFYVTPATLDLMKVILPDSGYLQEEQAKARLNKFLRSQKGQNDPAESASAANGAQLRAAGKKGNGRGQDKNGKARAQGKNSKNAQNAQKIRGTSQSRGGRSANVESNGAAGRKPGFIQVETANGTVSVPNSWRYAPLYTQADAEASLNNAVTVGYHQRYAVTDSVAFTFTDAGHILGAAVVNLEIGTGNEKRTFCFTGNVGRPNMPLLNDLEPVKRADYLMLEATYGNRLHQKRDRLEALALKLNEALGRAKVRHPKFGCGVIVIPAFAVGRAQTFVNDLRILMDDGRVPVTPVFVDGRMTHKATEVHRKHKDILNAETRAVFERGEDPYTTPRHHIVEDYQASQALRRPHDEPIIIVGSSGMAAGGRIVDHLGFWLPGKQNTVMFVGFQGTGTLGQSIVRTRDGQRPDTVGECVGHDCAKTVRIKGKDVRVYATVEFLPDYSAHADYGDHLQWLRKFTQRPKMTFIVHGDEEALPALKEHIEGRLGWNGKDIVIPSRDQVFDL